MTDLNRTVKRLSAGMVREAGKLWPVVISLEPPCVLGFRAKGCRRTYKLIANACYWLAVKADQQDRARQRRKQKNAKKTRSKKRL